MNSRPKSKLGNVIPAAEFDPAHKTMQTHSNISFRSCLNAIFSFSVIYALLGFVSGGVRLLSEGGLPLISGLSWKLGFGVVLLLLVLDRFGVLARLESRFEHSVAVGGRRILHFSSFASLAGLVLLLMSDFTERRFIFYTDKLIRFDLLYLGLVAVTLVFLLRRWKVTKVLKFELTHWALLGVQILLTTLFLKLAGNRLLFSDDHPSFLYRLQLLLDHFPNIPFYNTDWNAGYSAREFYSVGILSVFFLSWPIIRFANIDTLEGAVTYTYLIPYLFILILPWTVYLAGRILNYSRQSALLSALFALGPTMGFFEWMLKFGTLGFAVSCGLVPLTLTLALRLALDEKRPHALHLIALLASSICCLTWTLNFVAFVPALLLALCYFRRTFARERLPYVLGFAILFVLLNINWVLSFTSESRVLSFIQRETLPGSTVRNVHSAKIRQPAAENSAENEIDERREQPGGTEAKDPATAHQDEPLSERLLGAYKNFQSALVRINPLLIVFAIPGMLMMRSGAVRLALACTVCWLLFVGAFGDLYKPQLELRRMVVTASFLLALLAGPAVQALINRLLELVTKRRALAQLAAFPALMVMTSSVIISPITVGAAYSNRTTERFVFAPKLLGELSAAIREHGGSGRTFFLSFILHEFGATNSWIQNGGHVAPLATFSGHELYAFEFYHRRWASHDPIPEAFRSRDDAGVEEFLDLVNATSVVTFTPNWTEYCRKNPKYKLVFDADRFQLFTRVGPADGYLLKGKAKIERVNQQLIVTPESDEVVIKYRKLGRLRAEPADAVELFGEPAFLEDNRGGPPVMIEFVGLRARPGKDFRVPIRLSFGD